MARSTAWRRVNTDACSWHQDQALNTTIFILRETGPTGFLLKEEGEAKKFKVFLGDPHHCTCATFRKENDLCKHISWVLLKKFRIARQNPVTWQLGLVEREINEILHGVTAKQGKPVGGNARRLAAETANGTDSPDVTEAAGTVKQRPIDEDDVCPICQEELLAKHQPVTFCKFSCGNNIHIKCMKVWAEHQRTTKPSDAAIKCPVCREDFGPFSLLQQEFRNTSLDRANRTLQSKEHLGVRCSNCSVCPVVGKCYKCVSCLEYHMCQQCYITPAHTHHSFQFRERTTQRWKEAPHRGSGGALPEAVASQLMNRELGDNDYDLLLQLDNQAAHRPSDLSEESIKSFPLERIRQNSILLNAGTQCCVCLRGYQVGQYVRRLPCRHKFHRECIDNWLLHLHATCPVDGTVYTDASVRNMQDAERARRNQNTRNRSAPTRRGSAPGQDSSHSNLVIPGIGLAQLANRAGAPQTGNTPTSDSRSMAVRSRGNIDQAAVMFGLEGSSVPTAVLADRQTDNARLGFSRSAYLSKLRSRQQSLESALNAIRQEEANRTGLEQGEVNGRALRMQPSEVGGDLEESRESERLSGAGAHSHTQTPSSIDNALEAVALSNDPNHMFSEEGQSSHSHTTPGHQPNSRNNSLHHGRPVQSSTREPVAPSIPLRNNELDMTLNVGQGHSAIGESGSANQRRESQLPNHDVRGRRPAGRLAHLTNPPHSDRQPSSEANPLYVGNNPSTSSGLTSEHSMTRRLPRSHRGHPPRSHGEDSSQSETVYRWGEQREGVDNDLTLAGNAFSGLTLNDLVTKS